MSRSLRPLRLVALLLAAIACAAPPVMAQLQTFTTSELTIDTASGKHRFIVELAQTPRQMEQGLMYRRSLPADAGMLFEFRTPQIASFWMKNTLIPLDMLFIAGDGRVVGIHERAVPLSEEPIVSSDPVLAVLELNGGTAARLGIVPGDRVEHAFFKGS